MGRSRTRTSRGLIALLAIVIVRGVFFYFHTVNRTKAAAGAHSAQAHAQSRDVPRPREISRADEQLRDALIVTQAPLTAPATAPAQSVFSNNSNSTPASQPSNAGAPVALSAKPRGESSMRRYFRENCLSRN